MSRARALNPAAKFAAHASRSSRYVPASPRSAPGAEGRHRISVQPPERHLSPPERRGAARRSGLDRAEPPLLGGVIRARASTARLHGPGVEGLSWGPPGPRETLSLQLGKTILERLGTTKTPYVLFLFLNQPRPDVKKNENKRGISSHISYGGHTPLPANARHPLRNNCLIRMQLSITLRLEPKRFMTEVWPWCSNDRASRRDIRTIINRVFILLADHDLRPLPPSRTTGRIMSPNTGASRCPRLTSSADLFSTGLPLP